MSHCQCSLRGVDDDDRQSMADFVRAHSISAEARYDGRVSHFPGTPDPHKRPVDKWTVTLRFSGGGAISVPFYMGLGHSGKMPKTEDVLDSLASDASSYDQAGSAREFASEMGYDWDNGAQRINAQRVYRLCGQYSAKLKAMLGAQAYEALLYKTERL